MQGTPTCWRCWFFRVSYISGGDLSGFQPSTVSIHPASWKVLGWWWVSPRYHLGILRLAWFDLSWKNQCGLGGIITCCGPNFGINCLRVVRTTLVFATTDCFCFYHCLEEMIDQKTHRGFGWKSWEQTKTKLGGGFNNFLCSPLVVEDSHFD